jgi:hypothetical protein
MHFSTGKPIDNQLNEGLFNELKNDENQWKKIKTK